MNFFGRKSTQQRIDDQQNFELIRFKKINSRHKKINKLLVGFANSIFQSSGDICGPSNWTEAAVRGTVPSAGGSIEHWKNFEADLDLMVKMGVNSYRFSIEWSHIEPKQGHYNELAIKQYQKMFAACKKRGIEPMVTLFHFNEPLWFSALGSFEKESNIQYFKNFCEVMFQQFKPYVSLWCTINEPAVFAFCGYLFGLFPPHKHNLQKTLDVLTNLLKAHVAVYESIKNLPGGNLAQVGLVHNPIKFLPRHKRLPIEFLLTKFLTKITDTLVMNFLKTGSIHYYFPGIAAKKYDNPNAINSFDFLGLNFYANPVVGFNKDNFFGPTYFPGQQMGDMYLAIDPEGFSAAIDDFAEFKKPVYITEVGFADKSDQLRPTFLLQYLHVFETKLKENIDLRGLYYWTFADNYEWNHGHTKKFGVFDQNRLKKANSARILENFLTKYSSHTEENSKYFVPKRN